MAEIEDIQAIIMGGVDQPILNPHNLMVNVGKRPTNEELERQIGRLEHRNTYLKKKNEQLEELNREFEQVCAFLLPISGMDFCLYCEFITGRDFSYHLSNPLNCPVTIARKALGLKAKVDTANKRLGGE